jgi:hypothetical protein
MFNSNFPDRVAPKGREPNLPGDKYGRLTLVEEVEGQTCRLSWRKWAVVCECGEVRQVQRSDLRSGHTTSCACFMREVSSSIGRATATHGLENHPLYHTHSSMMKRCYNQKRKNFADYGGRGIQVCERWHDIRNFVADMAPSHQPGLSLERADNNAGYSPSNCVWATKIEQGRNKRNNRLIAYQGKNICLAEAREIAGLPYRQVYDRLRRGWPIEKALESEDFQEP